MASGKPLDILITANPISGMGQGLRIAQQLLASAQTAGLEATAYTQHPASLPADLLGDDPRTIVIVVGGDGTLRSVVDRLLQLRPQPHPLPTVAVVPLGTANLVAHHIGSMWNRKVVGEQVMAAIGGKARRQIDISLVNGKAMLAISGVGFDARVVHDLAARRRGPITYADYVLPTVRSLLGYHFPPISVAVDGKVLLANTAGLVFVGNIPEYGAGFSVTPTARPDDGLLDVCVLPCNTWQHLFELGALCGAQFQPHSDRAIYRRAKRIEITSPEPVPVQIDGDEGGFTPATIDLLPRQLTFIVPRQ